MKTQIFGQLLAVFAAVCGAFSSIIYSRISQKVNSDVLALIRMWIAFPLMALWAVLVDGLSIATVPVSCVLILLVSGFIGFFITDMFLFRAWAVYGANETMVVMCLAPILSTVFSAVAFGEKLKIIQYLGILITIAGIIISASSQISKKQKWFSYGLVCALVAAFLQSCSDLLIKVSVVEVQYTTSAAIRALGGVFGWSVYAVFRFRGKLRENKSLKDMKFMSLFFITVIIGTIVGTTLAVGAIKYAPIGIVTILKQMSPVFILPYDFFILKKRSWQAVAGTFVAIAGVVLFFI